MSENSTQSDAGVESPSGSGTAHKRRNEEELLLPSKNSRVERSPDGAADPATDPFYISSISSNESVENMALTGSKAKSESVLETSSKLLSTFDTPQIEQQSVRNTATDIRKDLSRGGNEEESPVASGSGVDTTKTSQIGDSGFLESYMNGHSTTSKPTENGDSSILGLLNSQSDLKKYFGISSDRVNIDNVMEQFHDIVRFSWLAPGWKHSTPVPLSKADGKPDPSNAVDSWGSPIRADPTTSMLAEPLKHSALDVNQHDNDPAETSSEANESFRKPEGDEDDQQQAALSPLPRTQAMWKKLQSCQFFGDDYAKNFTEKSDRKRQELKQQRQIQEMEVQRSHAKRLAHEKTLRRTFFQLHHKPLLVSWCLSNVGEEPRVHNSEDRVEQPVAGHPHLLPVYGMTCSPH